MGLIASFSITQALRHALTGKYPKVLLLQMAAGYELDTSGGGHEKHTMFEKGVLAGWILLNALMVRYVVPKLHYLGDGYVAHKVVHFTKVICIMLLAWGCLLLATWGFKDMWDGDQLFGYMLLSTLVTLACLCILILMARMSENLVLNAEEQSTINIAVTGVSLVAAWSWEHCFNIAFDVIGDRFQAGFGGFEIKLLLATILPMFLLPTYLLHVKRMVVEEEEKAHAAAHGTHGEDHEQHHDAVHAQHSH